MRCAPSSTTTPRTCLRRRTSFRRSCWLRDKRPDLWDRTRWLLDCKEYILFKLTGEVGIDWHGASVFFLFDPHKKVWDEEVCARLGIPVEKLPPAFPSTHVLGEVTPEAAAATGLRAGTPVVIAPETSPWPSRVPERTARARLTCASALLRGSGVEQDIAQRPDQALLGAQSHRSAQVGDSRRDGDRGRSLAVVPQPSGRRGSSPG